MVRESVRESVCFVTDAAPSFAITDAAPSFAITDAAPSFAITDDSPSFAVTDASCILSFDLFSSVLQLQCRSALTSSLKARPVTR
jgi:hypothetical protein